MKKIYSTLQYTSFSSTFNVPDPNITQQARETLGIHVAQGTQIFCSVVYFKQISRAFRVHGSCFSLAVQILDCGPHFEYPDVAQLKWLLPNSYK